MPLQKRVAQVGHGAQNAFVTAAEKLREEGRLQGRDEGLRAGHDEGQREMLRNLLTVKFGPLSADVQRKVDGASSADLVTWATRLVTAETLDAVFGE